MGDALLFGGSNGGGLRSKPITKSGYESLSEADKNNPYIIWVIKNDDGTDFVMEDGTEGVVNVIHWEAYIKLAEDDKMDPSTIWVISDLTEEDFAKFMKELYKRGLIEIDDYTIVFLKCDDEKCNIH